MKTGAITPVGFISLEASSESEDKEIMLSIHSIRALEDMGVNSCKIIVGQYIFRVNHSMAEVAALIDHAQMREAQAISARR